MVRQLQLQKIKQSQSCSQYSLPSGLGSTYTKWMVGSSGLRLTLTVFNPVWTWIILFVPNVAIWAWAIVDASVKPREFYEYY